MKKALLLIILLLFIYISCKNNNDVIKKNQNKIIVQSNSFKNGEKISSNFTCDGDNISPSISWSAGPENTKSYVLIADDPDAPLPGVVIVHWVLYNIPLHIRSISENLPESTELNNGINQGISYSGKNIYKGPCPPFGEHRYYFKIYAIDIMLDINPKKATKKRILKEIDGHILAYGEIFGTYERN